MKNLITYFCFACFISSYHTVTAQEPVDVLEEVPYNYKKRSPIYDYSEHQLNNTDTIPDFETKTNKLKITGTIFQNDGITPAKDVILYISQTDENGSYVLKTDNHEKRYVYHRGWIKTNEDGHYTFYTFVPGTFLRSNELKHIHPVIKEPNKPEYNIDTFLFDDDPLLTKSCRKRLKRRGIDTILKLEKKDGMYVATKDIILEPDQNILAYK
ncbi:MAG: hypothetical protein IMY67_09180 [Bacteroidetes bacterium]|nr:hypothetical protein [Bacteroidota bacterium]